MTNFAIIYFLLMDKFQLFLLPGKHTALRNQKLKRDAAAGTPFKTIYISDNFGPGLKKQISHAHRLLELLITIVQRNRSFNIFSKRETSNPPLLQTNDQLEEKGGGENKNFLWKLRVIVISISIISWNLRVGNLTLGIQHLCEKFVIKWLVLLLR